MPHPLSRSQIAREVRLATVHSPASQDRIVSRGRQGVHHTSEFPVDLVHKNSEPFGQRQECGAAIPFWNIMKICCAYTDIDSGQRSHVKVDRRRLITINSRQRSLAEEGSSQSGMSRRMFAQTVTRSSVRGAMILLSTPSFLCPTCLCVAARCRLHMPRVVQQTCQAQASFS